MWKEYF